LRPTGERKSNPPPNEKALASATLAFAAAGTTAFSFSASGSATFALATGGSTAFTLAPSNSATPGAAALALAGPLMRRRDCGRQFRLIQRPVAVFVKFLDHASCQGSRIGRGAAFALSRRSRRVLGKDETGHGRGRDHCRTADKQFAKKTAATFIDVLQYLIAGIVVVCFHASKAPTGTLERWNLAAQSTCHRQVVVQVVADCPRKTERNGCVFVRS
jgi:hypothetical protein